jgi:hypothetical protein
MAPILVVATNRGITRIRGTNYRCAEPAVLVDCSSVVVEQQLSDLYAALDLSQLPFLVTTQLAC